MPLNPKSTMKSDLKTLTLSPPASDDDDDDFQNPGQAVAITQSLILSSLNKPTHQPLKPSNGSRPLKRPKPAAPAIGKEKRKILQTPNSDPGIMPIRAEKRKLSPSIDDSGSVDISLPYNPNSYISSSSSEVDCDIVVSTVCEQNRLARVERKDLSALIGSGPVDNSDSCLSTEKGETVSVIPKGCGEKMQLKDGERAYYSMSIESRLLESRKKPVACDFEGGCLRGDDCGDFEIGTQLNELADLCCKMDEEGGLVGGHFMLQDGDLGVESSGLERNDLVDCPLCGVDMTGLSEELRQVHTNDCLDKDATTEESPPVNDVISNLPRQVDVNPVLEWLRNLDLSRYEGAFIREEIDWDTLQSLTEEDLLGIGVVALGPRKKIVHAINELRKRTNNVQSSEKVSSPTTIESLKPSEPGNKLITEYFQDAVANRNRVHSLNKPLNGTERSNNSVRKRVAARNYSSKAKVKNIPPWCCIPGTPFRVDAFRFLRGDCSHWFLTHFHIDHYQGLTRSFGYGKIYCSSITAHLVNLKIGVSWDKLHILPLNQKITIAGVNLTCLDANHCPGSVIILFEPSNGKAVLHTGDFRFSAEMANSPVLQSSHVHTLILDTTYCNLQYEFPKQDAVIQFVIEAIQAETFNPKTLFLIGTYTIGKERLFLEVARALKKKIYVGSAKLSLLRLLELPEEDMQWFTANEMESHIHVVPLWTIASFKRMKHISNQYAGQFNLIVAFTPTGWTFGKGMKKTPGRRWQQGTIIRYEVPYSEHCSFSELKEFVQFISPEHIIPSVNNDGPESADSMIALLMSDP